MLQFASPWLFLLLPLPWLLRRILPAYRPARPAVFVPFMGSLLKASGGQGSSGSPVAGRERIQWVLLALAWLLHQPGVTAPIIGASKMHQLEENVAALEIELSADELAALEEPYLPHPVLGHS